MPADGGFSGSGAPVRLQRVTGRASVTLGPGARLEGLHQSGSAKAFLPRIHGPVPEIVFLNTAGGLTGGDRISFSVTLAPDARAVATTQTAERAYASTGSAAEMGVRLDVGAGARLDWLPQETILFEGASLSRRTEVELGRGGAVVLIETVVLGRAAMGEALGQVRLTDWRQVRREGTPVLVEPLRITAETLRAGAAALDGARCIATIALVAPGAEDALASVRAALPDGVEAAASAWGGKCVVRLIGSDLLPVKRAAAKVLKVMRGCDLPRVWQL